MPTPAPKPDGAEAVTFMDVFSAAHEWAMFTFDDPDEPGHYERERVRKFYDDANALADSYFKRIFREAIAESKPVIRMLGHPDNYLDLPDTGDSDE